MDKKILWGVICVIVIIVIYYFYSNYTKNNSAGCKKISWEEWIKKKTEYKEQYGNWGLAHARMLDDGYCEQIG